MVIRQKNSGFATVTGHFSLSEKSRSTLQKNKPQYRMQDLFISEGSYTIRFFPKEETSLLRQLVFLHPSKRKQRRKKKKLWKGNLAISQLCLLTPPSLFSAQWLHTASINMVISKETHKNEIPENKLEICNKSFCLKIFSLFNSLI